MTWIKINEDLVNLNNVSLVTQDDILSTGNELKPFIIFYFGDSIHRIKCASKEDRIDLLNRIKSHVGA